MQCDSDLANVLYLFSPCNPQGSFFVRPAGDVS